MLDSIVFCVFCLLGKETISGSCKHLVKVCWGLGGVTVLLLSLFIGDFYACFSGRSLKYLLCSNHFTLSLLSQTLRLYSSLFLFICHTSWSQQFGLKLSSCCALLNRAVLLTSLWQLQMWALFSAIWSFSMVVCYEILLKKRSRWKIIISELGILSVCS